MPKYLNLHITGSFAFDDKKGEACMLKKEYQAKCVGLDHALAQVRSGDTISHGFFGNEPVMWLRNIHTVADRVRNVELWLGMVKEAYPVLTDLRLAGRMDTVSFFYSGALRSAHTVGRVDYLPTDLRNTAATLLHRNRPRVFVTAVSPMDEEGYFYLSCLAIEREMMEAADVLILEVNPAQPKTCQGARIHISQADFIYEADCELFYTGETVPDVAEQKIGEYVASLIKDGDTLQFGVGSLPEYVGDALYRHKDLGIHTEMLGNALCGLIEKGIVNNSKKNFYPHKSVCGFVWGNRHLYEYMNGYDDLEMLPSSYVNAPHVIAKNHNMVSVNSAMQIDLTGQVCSESVGSKQFSGTGGAFDFACGAFEAKGGRSIIAMRAAAKNDTISKIQVQLNHGAAVSISRNVVDYVVTEYGIAQLRGASIRQRARRLIAVAHPDFRGELTAQAKELLLL